MENKKTKIISFIAIIALVLTVITATYAYFQAQTGEGSQADVKINASTIDTLTFETGSSLTFTADQETFSKGKASLSDTTFAKAILTANNKTNSATNNYNLYLNISDNNFTYTQDTNTPELLLQITDASNNAITSIDGLTYKTITDNQNTSISGFDITTKTGLINLFTNREITTTSTKTEEWTIKITFVNYDADQSKNAGKSMNANVIIQKNMANYHELCNDATLACHVAKLYTGTQGENGLYFHNLTLENGAGDNSYRYAGSSDSVNNYVCFGSDATTCPEDNLYRIIGVFDNKVKIIKATIATSNLLGTDGAYVSDATYAYPSKTSCPSSTSYNLNNKMYQLANKNELSVSEPVEEDIGCNEWNYLDLNKTNLNENFLNNIGTKWSNMIEDTIWKISGTSTNERAAQAMFIEEITNSTKNYSPSDGISKIGLMYVSDYGFAASPSAWTLKLSAYNNTNTTNNNWLFSKINEWTLTRVSSTNHGMFFLDSVGNLESSFGAYYDFRVRPVMYLKNTIIFSSGTGTKNLPFRIS